MVSIDEQLFFVINHLNLGFLEPLFVLFRSKTFWIPLYLFVIYYIFRHFSWRQGAVLILMSIACIGVADQVSSEIIKKQIKRPRPCQTESGLKDVDLKVDCGGGYSFTSSHATNHMAIAIFWIFTVFRAAGKGKYWLIAWALLIGFCQIYVGVHYPSDVMSGFILGSVIGFGLAMIFNWLNLRFLIKPNETTKPSAG